MKFFVTTPIYYVNDRPHIGHVYTTIAADVLARFYRARGVDVLFSTGTDENSQKSVEAAERVGKDVREYVNETAREWQHVFKKLGFTHDVFIRTTSKEHRQAVVALLKKISESGDIYLGDYEGYYCVGCEEFISGKDLENGRCAIHRTEPKRIKEKNYFFRLKKYRDLLLEHYDAHPGFVQPASARNKMLHYIEHEMEDVSISRQAQEWGVRLPQDEKHAVYVWFDALINYLTVTGYPGVRYPKKKVPDPFSSSRGWEFWWPPDVHFIGKDIIKFHCAIWPAMLLSAGLELPKRIFAHGFFTIDGQKISKSLGNAIDPLELAKEYPFDAIRYYLLRDIPFGNDGDFSHDRLLERYNADLANGLGNLVSRTLNMVERFWPDFDKSSVTPAAVEQSLVKVDTAIGALGFDQALAEIWRIIAWADLLIEVQKPWELAKMGNTKKLHDVLSQAFEALKGINGAIAPFMPDTHEALTVLLGRRPIKKPLEPLFKRKK